MAHFLGWLTRPKFKKMPLGEFIRHFCKNPDRREQFDGLVELAQLVNCANTTSTTVYVYASFVDASEDYPETIDCYVEILTSEFKVVFGTTQAYEELLNRLFDLHRLRLTVIHPDAVRDAQRWIDLALKDLSGKFCNVIELSISELARAV